MTKVSKNIMQNIGFVLLVLALLSYSSASFSAQNPNEQQAEAEPQKGPNRGRLLKDGGFVVELAIFETGVPPEFRVWVTENGQAVDPKNIKLEITLTRLGDVKDVINFRPQADFLRGDMVVYEPHSFVVSVTARYRGQTHQWQYDNFEGRTTITSDVAEALDIRTLIAGSQTLKETVLVFGKLTAHPEYVRDITARFEGVIKKVHVSLGQSVKRGAPLITVESNESLNSYTIFAPISGIIRERNVNASEQTNGRVLLSIFNNSVLMSELSVFPTDRNRISIGATVWLSIKGYEQPVAAVITQIDGLIQPNQSIIVRAQLDNKNGKFIAGSFVKGNIEVAEYSVPLAVKRTGLQGFRDFTVVFVKIGNEYEVRMLDLGRIAGEWVEVLGGLKPGSEYVAKNSYIIKADIEKSGASHDH